MAQQVQPEQTPEAWDPVAEGYERSSLKFSAYYAAEVCGLLGVKLGERVLDVAAGTGAFAAIAAQSGADVLAIDFSPHMIERLQARIERERLRNLEAAVMDGQALNLPDNSFHVVCSVFGVMLFSDRAQGFREMYRVLKPGGRAAAVTWGRQERVEFFQLLARARQIALPELPPRVPTALSLQDPEVLRKEMTDSGFADVQVLVLPHQWKANSAQAFWEELSSFAPTISTIRKALGEEKVQALANAFIGLLTAQFGDGPVTLDLEANIGIGRK